MLEKEILRNQARRLGAIRNFEGLTQNISKTCRYFGISGAAFYRLARFALQKEGLDGFLYHLSALVEHLQLALHQAAIGTRGFSLFQYLDPGTDRIARFDRFGESQVLETQQGNHCVIVEVKLEQ